MELIPYKLYLIAVGNRAVGYMTVATIPAIDALDAINKYLVRIGFDSCYRYFYCLLMTTAITFDTRTSNISNYCFIMAYIEPIDCTRLSISSRQVTSYGDIFDQADPRDIDNPLFMRPTIEEVRNCIGFSRTPMYKLRKFCR